MATIVFVGVGLLLGAELTASDSRGIRVAHGVALSAPEPSVDGQPDYTTMTDVEIAAAIGEHGRWLAHDDSTRSFVVHAQIHPDHSATVTEEIVQVFRTERHGVERLIPTETDLGRHVVRDIEVSTSPDTPGNVQLADIDGGIRVRIGDPDVTVTNAHAYRLTYVLENVVEMRDGIAVVRLDALNDWQQDVDSLRYTIAADGAPLHVACFQGPLGSTDPCAEATTTLDGGAFTLAGTLAAGSSFTAEVTYPSDTFQTAATVTPHEAGMNRAVVMIGFMLAALMVGFGITLARARRSRAAAAAEVGTTFGDMAGGLVSDVRAHAPLEFVPPLDLDPASLIRLRDTWRVDVPDMLAGTLVDMAADGVVTIERNDDHWMVRRVDDPGRATAAHEQVLLKALLGKQDERDLATRDTAIGNAIDQFVRKVDGHLHELGLTTRPTLHFGMEGRAQPVIMTALACLGLALVGAVAFALLPRFVDPVWVVTGLGSLVAVGILAMSLRTDAGRTKEYTDLGRGAVWRLQGFERFFHDSEAIHARAAGRSGLIREYMGYAVAFDQVDRWVAGMPRDIAEAMTDPADLVEVTALCDVAHQRVYHRAAHHYATKQSAGGRGGRFAGSSSSGGGVGGGGGGSW